MTARRFSGDSDFPGELRAAVNVGIADVAGSRVQSFGTKTALGRHVQGLAAEVWSHRKSVLLHLLGKPS